jgi:8-oxo-dGTP diphosphatase
MSDHRLGIKMVNYVVGFMFKDDRVLLIRKNKPDWQKGRLNGVGGKIEPGELPLNAMIREFEEETGLVQRHWTEFVIMSGPGWRIHFYRAIGDIDSAHQMEAEPLEIIHLPTLYQQHTIPNLQWLIPLSLDATVDFPINITDK